MQTALKLKVLPEELDSLLEDRQLQGSPIAQEQMLSAYYDTADSALWGHGYTLCVQQHNDAWLQVLSKGKRREAVVSETGGEAVDSSKLPAHGKLGRQLGGILSNQALEPKFRLDLRRSQWQCRPQPDTEVAVTLDQGTIEANGREEPLCELQLRLIAGTEDDFYNWVLSLAQRYSLRWEDADAVTRGYRLASSAPVTHAKAAALALVEHASSEDAFAAIINACLEQLRANVAAAQAGQIEGIHQMRVAVRRLRSCLKLFRPLIPREASLSLVEELRWLNGFLGPARDWDVFIEEGMAPIFARFPDKRGLQNFHHSAEALRQTHRQALYRCLIEPRYHRLVLDLHAWLACQRWRQNLTEKQAQAIGQPVIEFATALLVRHHRRVVKRGKKFATLSMEERHALRIRIKQLRYALEFFASLYPGGVVDSYVKATASLQDDLGSLNDAVVAQRLLDEARLGSATPTRHLIEGWYTCNVYHHEQQFLKRWKRFRACKPPWK